MIVTYLAGETPFPVLAGDQVVQLPAGPDYQSYSVLSGPDGVVVEPLGPNTHNVYRKAQETVTDFADLAEALGVTMRAKPEPAPTRPVSNPHSRASRPMDINTMIGQDNLRLQVKMHVMGADEGRPIGHVLLEGPPGLGKTSLAMLLASLTDGRLEVINGVSVKSVEQLGNILSELKDNDVLLIDEIQMLTKKVMAALLTAMEDYRFDVSDNRGATATTESTLLRKFVLVGATTEPGALDRAMLDRFELRARLDYYDNADLTEIIHREAETNNWKIEAEAVESLVRRSRGTPRVAKRLLQTARKCAKTLAGGDPDAVITDQVVDKTFELAGVDENGLEKAHKQVLWQLCKTHRGGPVGMDRLSIHADMDPKSLREVESYLIRTHYVINTSRGRVATDKAYRAVGMEPKASAPKAADLAQLDADISSF